MNKVFFRAVTHSHNAKTGDIAQTYTSANTCAANCPLKSVCYAKQYHTQLTWNQCREDNPHALDIYGLKAWAHSLPEGSMIRHNVAGDLCHEDTDLISFGLMFALIDAYKGRMAYTYTHADKYDTENQEAIRCANAHGFTVNVSCETVDEVDYVRAKGLPAVLTVAEAPAKDARTPNGHKLVQCPAQTHKGVTCKTCKLCARADRDCVPVFVVHGNKKKEAARIIRIKVESAQ